MSVATASYVARRAAQKERVRILYRRALKDTLNWAVHRHLFYSDADDLREKFESNRQLEDIELIDRMIATGEATYNKWRHPDPYIVISCEQFHGRQAAPNFAEIQHHLLGLKLYTTTAVKNMTEVEIFNLEFNKAITDMLKNVEMQIAMMGRIVMINLVCVVQVYFGTV